MRKRKSTRQSPKLQTSIKATLALVSFTVSSFILLLIIVFNFTKQEKSVASSPMVFSNARAIHDTMPVWRGSLNQQAIGLVIQTTGAGNPLKITSFEFRVEASSGNAAKHLENARVWTTGNDSDFVCLFQTGITMPAIPDGKFSIAINKELLPGKNYFWLTFDISKNSGTSAWFETSCTEIKAGAISYVPLVARQSGKRLIQPDRVFFSTGNLLVNHVNSWNTERDGSGKSPAKLDDDANVFFVQNGHYMQNSMETTLPAIVIEKGGRLKSKAVLRANNMLVENGGVYEQTAELVNNDVFKYFKVATGGTYIHNHTGVIPGLRRDFCSKSYQKFHQYGPSTFGTLISWGHVEIISGSNINLDIHHGLGHIKGNLEFRQTGAGNYLFCSESDTMIINGNLVFSGGNFTGITGKGHTLIFNIYGDLIMKAGVFTDAQAVNIGFSRSILNIRGDVIFEGGTFDFAQALHAASEMNLLGEENKEVNWNQTGGEVLLGNVRINSGKQLSVSGPYLGNVSTSGSFIVETGASLFCGKSQLTGDGRFVLENNATIAIGHVEGLYSTGLIGNIITAKRVFSSGANFIYYMDQNPQKTGKFHTEPEPGTVRNLTIMKDAPSQWVLLSQDILVSEKIRIVRGVIEKNSRRLLESGSFKNTMPAPDGLSSANR